MRIIFPFLLTVLLQGCGSFTPLPSHGGGKRFAIEQQLISAVAKRAILDLPIEDLRGLKGYVNITVIYDEGGGYVNGGRLSASEVLGASAAAARSYLGGDGLYNTTRNKSAELAFNVSKAPTNYSKDISFNSSDGRHFVNLASSFLLRNNIMKDPNPETDGPADFIMDVMVDTMGTIWKRTDWGVVNSDSLTAVVSYEYEIIPLKDELKKISKVGNVSYEAKYQDNYVLWMGPTKSETIIQKSDFAETIGTLGPIFDSNSSIERKGKRQGFVSPATTVPIQISPSIR
jgi:hypothetical protein